MLKLSARQTGLFFLWLSILAFSASNSVVNRLGQVGAHHLINGRNPISFCNVLFAGNLIAAFVFIALYRKSLNMHSLKQIKLRQWGSLSMIAVSLSIFSPVFYFIAIMTTSVINVVLISSSELVWNLILGYLMFRERVSVLALIGTLFALAGVGLTFYLHQLDQMSIPMRITRANLGTGWLGHFIASSSKAGEVCAALGAFFSALGDMLSKKYIKGIPDAIFNTYRTIVGSIFFFIVVMAVFGWQHFADLWSPFLWEWMLVYGGVIIATGVYSWARAAPTVETGSLAIANAASRLFGVIFALLIAGEIPDHAQIIGGVVIFAGIAIGLYDDIKSQRPTIKRSVGFKGV